MSEGAPTWPALPVAEWHATRDTLQLWTQIVGKVRLARTPMTSHWWNVPLYVTARGLSTSMIPANGRGFQIDFDFTIHELDITVSDGQQRTMRLEATAGRGLLRQRDGDARRPRTGDTHLDDARRDPRRDPVREGHIHASYDRGQVERFWRALIEMVRVFEQFRAEFVGKVSPVHLFWGGARPRRHALLRPAAHRRIPVAHPTAART